MQQRPANALSHDIRVNPKMLQFDGGCFRIQLAEPEQPFTILRHESGSLGDRFDAWTEALPPRVELECRVSPRRFGIPRQTSKRFGFLSTGRSNAHQGANVGVEPQTALRMGCEAQHPLWRLATKEQRRWASERTECEGTLHLRATASIRRDLEVRVANRQSLKGEVRALNGLATHVSSVDPRQSFEANQPSVKLSASKPGRESKRHIPLQDEAMKVH